MQKYSAPFCMANGALYALTFYQVLQRKYNTTLGKRVMCQPIPISSRPCFVSQLAVHAKIVDLETCDRFLFRFYWIKYNTIVEKIRRLIDDAHTLVESFRVHPPFMVSLRNDSTKSG